MNGVGPTAAEWSLALEPGEKMLWMGQPTSAGTIDTGGKVFMLVGGLFAVIGSFFFVVGLIVGPDLMFKAVFSGLGLIFAVVGLGILLVPRHLRNKRVAQIRYALTDRRALIYEGGSIESYPVDDALPIEIQPGNPGSIIFGQKELPYMVNGVPAYRDIGFIAVPDLLEVGQMMRDIQGRQTSRTEAAS